MPDGKQPATAAAGQLAQQSASTLINNTLVDGKLKDATGKAQQVASLYQSGQQALGQANAISGTFNNKATATPFEDLDTPDATAAAASQNDNPAAAAMGDILAAKIAAKVFIGELGITEILSLKITQELGSHNQLNLRFFQDQAQTQGAFTFDGAEKLLGQVAEIELYNKTDPSSSPLRNLFVIADVQFQQDALNEGIIELIGYAPTWILDGQPHFETFYKKDLGSIAQSVCKSLSQVKASLKSDPTLSQILPFVCRYNESVWNFLKRLSAETGQWLYFSGSELVFGQAGSTQSSDLVYGQNCYKLAMSMQARPVQSGYFDYNAPDNEGLSQAANSETDMADSDRGFAFGKAKNIYGEESYTHPSALPADAQLLSHIGKGKANTVAADLYAISGESTIHNLSVGNTVNLKMIRARSGQEHTPIRIISVTHHLDATGHYHNSFQAISAQSTAPPDITFIKPATTSMAAEVISNNDPLGQGRVQVKFLGWKQEHSQQQTDWIRILTPDAGSSDVVNRNRGYVFIPEPGDQVMIDFEQNNPDRPFVQGSIFHGSNGMGGGTSNNTKSIMTRSGHTIELNDDNNGTHIIIKDPGGNEIHFDTQGKNITITAPETITLNAKNIVMNAGENITGVAGANITHSAGFNVLQNAGDSFTQYAVNDFMLTATNITKIASENMATQAKDIESTAEAMKMDSSKNEMTFNAGKSVNIKSAEKSKLF